MQPTDLILPSNTNVVFRPIPGSSQELAIDSRVDHTLYHGARGPGKTITQLMRFRRRVGQGYGSYWRGVIFDREFKNLSDIINQSNRFFPKFEDGCKYLSSQSDLKWVWPTGEQLLFRHVKRDSDYDNFHGHEYPFIGWNELTKFPTGMLYQKMMSCNRSSYKPDKDGYIGGEIREGSSVPVGPDGKIPPPIPLEVFSTTNPSGPGHNWVKEEFIDCAPTPGAVVRKVTEIFNPRLNEVQKIVKSQVAIFGNAFENIYLDEQYLATLANIRNENLRKAWLYGDWNVVAGGAFDDVFRKSAHVKPRFKVPSGWALDRSFDWGSSHPFSCGWWAEANGEEAMLPDGTKFCPPPGSLVQVFELYGAVKGEANTGLKWSSTKIAQEIKRIEVGLMQQGYLPKQPFPGPADNQISDVRESDVETIADKMAREGVRWERSDKSPGSRKIGMQLLRDRFEAVLEGEGPGLYFMDNCVNSIKTIPVLPRDDLDPDDVDTDAEDHAYDMVRYRVLKSGNRYARTPKISFAT